MGISRVRHDLDSFPTWTRTLGAMIDGDCKVRVICTGCEEWRDVDLVALAERVGRADSLIDRRCRCRLTPGCRGWNTFRYLAGVFRPLRTDAASYRWMGLLPPY